MSNYHQLSKGERKQIYYFMQQGYGIRAMGNKLDRSPSTISREIRRNKHSPIHLYYPVMAHSLATKRRKNRPYDPKFSREIIRWIELKLRQQWSPEQISGRLHMEKNIRISHEWIYQWVLKDRKTGGTLFKNLRQSHRKHRKRYGVPRQKKKCFEQARSIEERPIEVVQRSRVGDWEGDTIVGAQHISGIVSLTERVSLFSKIGKVKRRTAQEVRNTVIELFSKTLGEKHTLTFDRGSEFSEHEKIEKETGIEIYFAHPYCSYERGTNENYNGLVRQYFPKRKSFKSISNEEIKKVEWLLNHRPRKKLGYLTPFEVYYKYCPYPKGKGIGRPRRLVN
jgi:transposase, IS30 family